MLNFPKVRFGALRRFRTVGIPAVVPLYPFVVPIPLQIVPEDTGSEIDVIFDFEEVDALLLYYAGPSRNVYLHDADGIPGGNRERVAPALNDQDAGDQAGIKRLERSGLFIQWS